MRMHLITKIGRHISIYVDRYGRYYQHVVVPKAFKRKSSAFAFPCQGLCGHNLRRPHFSCLFCRLRRVCFDKMPSLFEVRPYVLLIKRERRLRKVKDILLKKLLTLAEFLAN